MGDEFELETGTGADASADDSLADEIWAGLVELFETVRGTLI